MCFNLIWAVAKWVKWISKHRKTYTRKQEDGWDKENEGSNTNSATTKANSAEEHVLHLPLVVRRTRESKHEGWEVKVVMTAIVVSRDGSPWP